MVFAVCVFAGAARAATDPGGHVDEYSSFASLSANGPLDLYEAVRHGPGDGPYPFGGDPRPFNPEWQMSLPRESYHSFGGGGGIDNNPTSAVPEPRAYVLLLLGFAWIAAATCRREAGRRSITEVPVPP
ncbi:MAG TPA: hypothetical protein VED47_11725 [Burkholderiaceae bacterium]|nr:hypothetical protein [Burkholderiaceae bacterium]